MMEIYLAGAAAAFTVDVLVYPLDTLKTRYQTQDFIPKRASGPNQKPLAIRGLYQGIGSVVLATLPAAGVFFSTYESTKVVFSRTLPVPEPVVHFCASGVAELASCLVLAPAEIIKQNAQMIRGDAARKKHGHSSTSMMAFRHLVGAGAASRLFSGYIALVARNLPFTALQFPAFERIRSRLWKARLDGDHSRLRGLLETGLVAGTSAATAGAFAAFLTTPSDVVKTRIMVEAGTGNLNEAAPAQRTEKGSWAVAQDVFRQKGIKGFFRGGLFRSAWTALGSGLYLGMYDIARLWLERRKPGVGSTNKL